MEDMTYAGSWWRPEDSDNAQPGVLRIASDGTGLLELVGGFDTWTPVRDADGATKMRVGDRELAIIHGDAEGKRFTLISSITKTSRGGLFASPQFQTLEPQRVLIGMHLKASGDAVFRGAIMRFENLTSWAASENLAYTLPWDSPDGFEARITKADPVVAIDDRGWTYSAETSSNGFGMRYSRQATTLTGDSTTVLRVTPAKPAQLADFDTVVLEMMDLLTLASGDPCGVISMELAHVDDVSKPRRNQNGEEEMIVRPLRVQEFGRRVHTANPDAAAPKEDRLFFSCRDVGFDVLFPRWLRIRRRAQAACNVYFGMKYSPRGYVETQLLTTAIAAESLAGALFGDEKHPQATGLTRDQISVIRDSVKDALTDPAERHWALGRLNATASYRDRMAVLAHKPDPKSVGVLIPDINTWTRQLQDARNGLAHSGGAVASIDLFELMWHTRGLIALVLMNELGLSAEVQQFVAEESRVGEWHPYEV